MPNAIRPARMGDNPVSSVDPSLTSLLEYHLPDPSLGGPTRSCIQHSSLDLVFLLGLITTVVPLVPVEANATPWSHWKEVLLQLSLEIS